jgi:hypothetical protein
LLEVPGMEFRSSNRPRSGIEPAFSESRFNKRQYYRPGNWLGVYRIYHEPVIKT